MTGESRRVPALDGLRGVAVLLVVVSHLSRTSLRPLGMAGVVVFFTLSGFLITRLLLEEHADRGQINLRAFYARRLRRLAPAALACIAVVAAAGLVAPVVVLGALTNTANWFMTAGVGSTGALAHTWSLAIEEQFYLAWPLLLVGLLRFRSRLLLVAVLSAGITFSALARVAHYGDGWDRVYYGTDTRADALLIGCLLAVTLNGTRRSPWMLAPLAVAVATSPIAPGPYVLLLLPLVVAVATAAAISVRETRALAWRPLRYVGQRSYGLYLWHWPVFVVVNSLLGAPGWLTLALVGLPLSWLLTELSWRYVEQRFLQTQAGRASTFKTAGPATPPAYRRPVPAEPMYQPHL